MIQLLTPTQDGSHTSVDIGSRLRQETASEHQRIETLMRGFLFSDDFDVNAYYKMLLLKRDYYELVESCFERFTALEKLVKDRTKVTWLDADISFISKLVTRPSQRHFSPLKEVVLLPETEAQAYGFLYVFEGATLGGAHITSALSRHDCFQAGEGLQFFNSYGRHTPAKWREFQAYLAQYCQANPSASEGIVEGAKQSFNNMYRIMQRVNHG